MLLGMVTEPVGDLRHCSLHDVQSLFIELNRQTNQTSDVLLETPMVLVGHMDQVQLGWESSTSANVT